MRQGQAAMEFTLITVAMMIFFVASLIVAQGRLLDVQNDMKENAMANVLNSLESELSLAEQAGEGFSRNISLPITLHGTPYEVGINENQTPGARDELWVRIGDDMRLRFLPMDVQGNFEKGINTLYGGQPVVITQP